MQHNTHYSPNAIQSLTHQNTVKKKEKKPKLLQTIRENDAKYEEQTAKKFTSMQHREKSNG